MEFGPNLEGDGWVEPAPGMTAAALRIHLPPGLRDRPESGDFLRSVVKAASIFYSMYRGGSQLTAAETRDPIELLEKAAHELQNVLRGFSGGDSEEFESLNTHFDVLVARNNGRGMPTADKPVLPPLPTATPELDALLTRINTDLSALRIGCDYAVSRMKPNRNRPKDREMEVAKAIARCYKTHFGKTPPKRGTFAPFVEEVGRYLSLNIGAAITASAVESLE